MIIIWGSFLILFLLNYFRISDFKNYESFISLFAALSAITGILYSNHMSDKRNELSLINSNNQLIEQLTRDKKEHVIFTLLKKILDVLNDDLKKSNVKWIAKIDFIIDQYEESQRENEHYYSEFNLFVQNELYYYFNELMNNPFLFNYLPPEIQKEIKNFNKSYYNLFQKFYFFILARYDGSLEKVDIDDFDFTIIEKNSRPNNYHELGNYLIKDMIESYIFNPIYNELDYIPINNETVIIRIEENEYNNLEFILNKITYLTYKESLKYGFEK